MKYLTSALLTACLTAFSLTPALAQSEPTPAQVKTTQKIKVYPLPGGLDQSPMLNSNSPEIVEEAGILVSTLPGKGPAYLDYGFKGRFGIFSHHIARDKAPGERLLYLGTLVSNPHSTPVKLQLESGASYLSQPDALFKKWPGLMNNPDGTVYAGPGDRVTTELLTDTDPVSPRTIVIPPRSTQLISSLSVPTDVAILPPINGRSTLLYFNSPASVYVSHVAYFANKVNGQFVSPTLEDYRALLNSGKMAGKRESAPTNYMRDPKPKGAFRYGRVAGVSQGLTWKAKLFEGDMLVRRPEAGETIGYPFSAVYLKRMGTSQNQSGELLRRYPDTAYQNHANYGVRYDIDIPLHNRTGNYQTYSVGLAHPTSQDAQESTFVFPPNKPVMFRGSSKLSWVDEYAQPHTIVKHHVLQHGQEPQQMALITVPPGIDYDLKLSMYYPADCTPPQLLTLSRIE